MTVCNGVGYNPSPDALDQVQVVSANAQAEYGNVNGGEVIALTKSGTNNWHGSVFYFLSDGLLDANTWTNKHNSKITPRRGLLVRFVPPPCQFLDREVVVVD